MRGLETFHRVEIIVISLSQCFLCHLKQVRQTHQSPIERETQLDPQIFVGKAILLPVIHICMVASAQEAAQEEGQATEQK